MEPVQSFQQEIVGLFGSPVAENPTQAMVEAAFRHHDLKWRYLTLEVAPDNLEAAVNGARAMGFRGFNCTIPHKVTVIPYLDALGESAATIGAVNCVVAREGKLIGENTDGKGFLTSLSEVTTVTGASIAILGAGGAARAIAVETALAGAAEILVLNRTRARGEELAALINGKTKATARFEPLEGDYAVPADTDVVVNATSIGLFPDTDAHVPLDLSAVKRTAVVADVIPNPPRTRLVREAQEAGFTVLDGLGMLVQQGALGIEYWCGVSPDPAVMRRALEDALGLS